MFALQSTEAHLLCLLPRILSTFQPLLIPFFLCRAALLNEITLIYHFSHHTANACLFPICALHHVAVTTVEGIGNTKSRLHPAQVSY